MNLKGPAGLDHVLLATIFGLTLFCTAGAAFACYAKVGRYCCSIVYFPAPDMNRKCLPSMVSCPDELLINPYVSTAPDATQGGTNRVYEDPQTCRWRVYACQAADPECIDTTVERISDCGVSYPSGPPCG
ncbi:MAG: hypothetical protein KIT68_07210 [Phycisphaeraceae bacterium]|nr:hypothetical protein [Phycisphaeraceae bacterium]